MCDSIPVIHFLFFLLTLTGSNGQNIGLGTLFPTAKGYEPLNCDLEQDRTVMETFSISCELVLTSLHDVLLSKVNSSVLNSLGRNEDLPTFGGDNTTAGSKTPWKVFLPGPEETLEESQQRKDVCMALLKFDTLRHKCCYRLLDSCPEYVVGGGTTDTSGSVLGITNTGQTTDIFGGLLTNAVGNFVEMIKRQLGFGNPHK